jgi:hypothetical protein
MTFLISFSYWMGKTGGLKLNRAAVVPARLDETSSVANIVSHMVKETCSDRGRARAPHSDVRPQSGQRFTIRQDSADI